MTSVANDFEKWANSMRSGGMRVSTCRTLTMLAAHSEAGEGSGCAGKSVSAYT